MWEHCKVEQAERVKQAGTFDDTNNEEYCDVMLEDVDEVMKTMRIEEEPLVDDEIQHAEKFHLYTTLSSTPTTNCFAPMFKCMMNCDNSLRRLSETLTN